METNSETTALTKRSRGLATVAHNRLFGADLILESLADVLKRDMRLICEFELFSLQPFATSFHWGFPDKGPMGNTVGVLFRRGLAKPGKRKQ